MKFSSSRTLSGEACGWGVQAGRWARPRCRQRVQSTSDSTATGQATTSSPLLANSGHVWGGSEPGALPAMIDDGRALGVAAETEEIGDGAPGVSDRTADGIHRIGGHVRDGLARI